MMKCGRCRGNNTRPPFDGTKVKCGIATCFTGKKKKPVWAVITVGGNEMPVNNDWSCFFMNFIDVHLITAEKPQRLSITTSHHVPDFPNRRRLLSVCFASERQTQLSSRWKRKKKISPKTPFRICVPELLFGGLPVYVISVSPDWRCGHIRSSETALERHRGQSSLTQGCWSIRPAGETLVLLLVGHLDHIGNCGDDFHAYDSLRIQSGSVEMEQLSSRRNSKLKG